ncbi:MAG: Eukaryotic translation initiation factor 5A-1 [Marteilia pararefringens]
MLNLNETADLHYRYKMPRIEARVESRGNGIKTAVLNLAKVSNALSRPPAYMLKYLSYELGCVSDDTNDRYIINGAHSSERIQALVYSFIKKFILCSACSNPETNIRVVGATVKKSVANLECTACGSKTLIDNSHKLTSYIIKNPPSDKYEQLMTNKRQGKSKKNFSHFHQYIYDRFILFSQ